jgi:hypothetical protein
MNLMDMRVFLGFLGFLRWDTEVQYPRGLMRARPLPLQRRSKGVAREISEHIPLGVEQRRAGRAGRAGGR